MVMVPFELKPERDGRVVQADIQPPGRGNKNDKILKQE